MLRDSAFEPSTLLRAAGRRARPWLLWLYPTNCLPSAPPAPSPGLHQLSGGARHFGCPFGSAELSNGGRAASCSFGGCRCGCVSPCHEAAAKSQADSAMGSEPQDDSAPHLLNGAARQLSPLDQHRGPAPTVVTGRRISRVARPMQARHHGQCEVYQVTGCSLPIS